MNAVCPAVWAEKLYELRDKIQTAKNHFIQQRELKDRAFWVDAASALKVFFRKGRIILFFPERTSHKWAAYECCAFLGYTIIKNPTRRFDVAFKRVNNTLYDSTVLDKVPLDSTKIINAESVDISKRRVDQVSAGVFGYALGVNPASYSGPILEKSDANGAHDGRVLQGPLSAELIRKGRVYQKLIDNRSFIEDYFLEYRVVFHGDLIPLVYLKHRPKDQRFTHYDFPDLRDPQNLFTLDELKKIRSVAKIMGLDFGELDVLRDSSDGRIYVIDVNNTPMAHTVALPKEIKRAALKRLAASFERLIETYS